MEMRSDPVQLRELAGQLMNSSDPNVLAKRGHDQDPLVAAVLLVGGEVCGKLQAIGTQLGRLEQAIQAVETEVCALPR